MATRSNEYAASELLHTIAHELWCDYKSKQVNSQDLKEKFLLHTTLARLQYVTLVGKATEYDSWVHNVLNQLDLKANDSLPPTAQLQEKTTSPNIFKR